MAQRRRWVLFWQVKSKVGAEWGGEVPQCRDSGQCILPFIGSVLRIGQRESVVKIVGKKLEEGPVDFGGFVPVPGSLMITSLNQKAFRARQVGRKFEGLLRLNFGIFVIAELRPSGSQGRVRKRESGFRRYGRLQKIARPERIKAPQPHKSLRLYLPRLAR